MKNKNRIWIYPLSTMGLFIMFLSMSFKSIAQESSETVNDIDGNVYKTVEIGTQTWMAENLRTIKYNDGTNIPLVTDDEAWSNLSTPGYCWIYQRLNDSTNKKYGVLYNWYTVSTGNLCPTGWHVPTYVEWTTLIDYLGPWVAGGKLKDADTTHWGNPNVGATNETGFTALPGGFRLDNGLFWGFTQGFWWCSTTKKYRINYKDVDMPWSMVISNTQSVVTKATVYKKGCGFAVRCLKD